ncbi:MAG: hypothetical protein KGJ36_00970 [Acidobacteriota bacterium]|nr:hypothetical protein [Acidobacteriota bacterium]
MRRLVTLLVVALVGAGLYGWSGASSGVQVSGQQVAAGTLRSELGAIAASSTLACYLSALGSASFTPGSGGDTLSAAGAAAWTQLRVEGLAIEQYVSARLHHRLSARELAVASSSLAGELTTAAAGRCAGTSSQALGAMTTEMRDQQVRAQAASLYLVGRLSTTIPLTSSSLHAYYASHAASYDTLCISVAVVAPTKASAFRADQSSGMSVVALVHKYSLDGPSAARGGALGCFAPGQNGYSTVRQDVATATLNTFPSTPRPFVANNGLSYDLYIALTKRTATPFASASPQVYADVQSLNAGSAGVVKENILYRAAVAVDPAFGRWGLATSGPGVFAPAVPPTGDVVGATALSGSSGATYK